MARVKRVDLRGQSLDPTELFAKYHIVGLRHTKNGYIRQVKHVQFGWMKPEEYYRFQKLHDLIPVLMEVVKGGYALKASLWGVEVGIAGVSLPLGAYIPIKGLTLAISAFNAGNQTDGLKWLVYTFAPFGDIFILFQIWSEITGVVRPLPAAGVIADANRDLWRALGGEEY